MKDLINLRGKFGVHNLFEYRALLFDGGRISARNNQATTKQLLQLFVPDDWEAFLLGKSGDLLFDFVCAEIGVVVALCRWT